MMRTRESSVGENVRLFAEIEEPRVCITKNKFAWNCSKTCPTLSGGLAETICFSTTMFSVSLRMVYAHHGVDEYDLDYRGWPFCILQVPPSNHFFSSD